VRGQELADRLRFDYEILNDMRCDTFDFEAYRTNWDLDRRANRITSLDQASDARKYRFVLRVPTLVSPGTWAPITEIGVDTDVNDYPEREPNTFVMSPHIPWSPHFKQGMPVCIGAEFWEARSGHIVLGELVVHLQRLLNWDEKGRGPGYVGWNGDAVEYQRTVLNGRPLNTTVVYAQLPGWLAGQQSGLVFEIENRRGRNPGFEVL
jgi:hypothetical protein